jgi:hypothetical protein
MTLDDLLVACGDHCTHHLAQIASLRTRMRW